MKLTWTFYPRLGDKISLEITYGPTLDKYGTWGILNVDANKAVVCWECFKVFDRGSTKEMKEAFQRLTRVNISDYNNSPNVAQLIDTNNR